MTSQNSKAMSAPGFESPARRAPTVRVRLLPQDKSLEAPRPKTVIGLLNRLNLRAGSALVIRDGVLLTPDREILPDDEITVRIVTSSG